MSHGQASLAGVYAITPGGMMEFDDVLRLSTLLLDEGLCAIQYRDKDAGAVERKQRARQLLDLCRAHGTPLIINDDPLLAATIGADGVHLGADDSDPVLARKLLGPAAIIGVSCYNDADRAARMAGCGADYIALGAFFPTTTKPARSRATLDILRQARDRVACPVVAIGGITPENSPPLLAAGANALAVVSALYLAADPRSQLHRFRQLFSGFREPGT